jgi:hypothetical protein
MGWERERDPRGRGHSRRRNDALDCLLSKAMVYVIKHAINALQMLSSLLSSYDLIGLTALLRDLTVTRCDYVRRLTTLILCFHKDAASSLVKSYKIYMAKGENAIFNCVWNKKRPVPVALSPVKCDNAAPASQA